MRADGYDREQALGKGANGITRPEGLSIIAVPLDQSHMSLALVYLVVDQTKRLET